MRTVGRLAYRSPRGQVYRQSAPRGAAGGAAIDLLAEPRDLQAASRWRAREGHCPCPGRRRPHRRRGPRPGPDRPSRPRRAAVTTSTEEQLSVGAAGLTTPSAVGPKASFGATTLPPRPENRRKDVHDSDRSVPGWGCAVKGMRLAAGTRKAHRSLETLQSERRRALIRLVGRRRSEDNDGRSQRQRWLTLWPTPPTTGSTSIRRAPDD